MKSDQEIRDAAVREKVCRFCQRKFKSRGVRRGHETKMHQKEIMRMILFAAPAEQSQ